ncbi:MAG: MoaD/ThiS family protein [Anaerolineae bacterium]|nr:MoaD/ThiS family protein [Anaerolineae bacterium]
MEVTVKLFAMLQRYASEELVGPAPSAGHPFELDLPDTSTIADLLVRLGIPEREVKVTFVDGRARAPMFRLAAGSEIGIFPPIGGG